jgi:hypothetical protein
MKYLDERITIQMDFGSPMPSAGMYRYVIYEYWEWAQSDDDEIIFTGNFYYGRNSRYYTFDITDIVRSRKYTFPKEYILDNNVRTGLAAVLTNRYKIRVYLDEGSVTSSWNNVAMIYRYPNVKKGLTDGSGVYTNVESGYPDVLYPLLQGYNETKIPPLISHYPLKNTRNYKFCQSFITSIDVQEFQLWLTNSNLDDYYSISVAQEGNTTTCMITLDAIVDWQYYQQELDRDVNVYKAIDDDFYNKIAVLDYCYKRYYLLWQDRYGGFQSQALLDNVTFSETFDVTETQNYRNERRKSFIQVQPKWKLSTGWIKEDVFPYYESIYVSPILVLYDAYEDKSYEVIVNSSYTEKTYKNEKKMLNISLDLEASSKQNIMY